MTTKQLFQQQEPKLCERLRVFTRDPEFQKIMLYAGKDAMENRKDFTPEFNQGITALCHSLLNLAEPEPDPLPHVGSGIDHHFDAPKQPTQPTP